MRSKICAMDNSYQLINSERLIIEIDFVIPLFLAKLCKPFFNKQDVVLLMKYVLQNCPILDNYKTLW